MNVEPYLENLKRRGHATREERLGRAEKTRSRLAETVRILVDEFAVRRILVFGSLLTGELHERSDVDLAVEGLSSSDYWRALDRVTVALGVSVDLVSLEEASDSLRARILEEGEVVHE